MDRPGHQGGHDLTTRAPELTQDGVSARPATNRWLRWAFAALAIAVLYLVYWRESWSAAANSDSAATALQAWDVLHGNVLLHGWFMSDVSFYTTEVPQYAILEVIGGLGPWVVHVAAATTYTLIVVLVALLAKGSATGRQGWTRAILAGLIVASPQVSGTLILLLGPDHTGTVVPVLATWLLIDRARPRWYVPVVTGVLLTWIMVADSVVLFTGIAPLIVAAVIRSVRPSRTGQRPGQRWYELSLAAAAVVAAVLGTLIPKLIVYLGGFKLWHFQTRTMPLGALPHDAWNTVQAVLELFGANVFGAHPLGEQVLCAFHFAGVLLAVAGLVVAIFRFVSEDGILVPGLAVAIVLELGAFLVSIHSQNLASIREIVAVMPLAAVLAGRLLAAPLTRLISSASTVKLRGPVAASAPAASDDVLAVSRPSGPAASGGLVASGPSLAASAPAASDNVLAGSRPRGLGAVARARYAAAVGAVVVAAYLAAMGYGAAQPAIPSSNQALASWLAAHHLTGGFAAYWQAGSVTLDSGGAVKVSGVDIGRHGTLGPYYWETNVSDYDHLRRAAFVVTGGPKSVVPVPGLAAAAIRTLGQPAHIYHVAEYTILTW